MKASSAQRHIRLSNPPAGFKASSELLQRAARAPPAPPSHLLRTRPGPLQQRGGGGAPWGPSEPPPPAAGGSAPEPQTIRNQ